ncbi:MAG: ABC transporter permease [Lachnospiraceae bacterium]|nr:ABC transporter permease [Lachnospiraceae bacterium]
MQAAKGKKYHGLKVLFEKEVADFINSKRMLLLILFMIIITISGLYAALSGISDSVEENASFIFLKLFTVSANSIPSYNTFLALLGPFIGLIMGFDAINNERSEGTLNRLVSQPVYRDNIIIGKFLAGCFIIVIMIFASGILIGAVGFLQIGIPPEAEELGRLFVYLCFAIIYIAFWLALSILFSTVCRHAATSALATIAVWLFSAIFVSLLAGIIADAIYPLDNYEGMFNQLNNYNCELNLNRLSPYYLFSEAASTILSPSIRSINAVTVTQLSGALSGYLSLGQSLLLVWPHLTALCALMLIMFAISYVFFMRQEIRAN